MGAKYKQMDLEEVTCPVCGSGKASVWGYENGFTGMRCAPCKVVYVSPRPTDERITEANRLGQHQTEQGVLKVHYRRNAQVKKLYHELVRTAYAREIAAGQPIRWLDVGAGYGELVEVLRSILPRDSEIIGLEPMEAKVAYARARGLPVTGGSLADIGGPFDVISLMNVFSHVPNFRQFLTEILQHLASDGSLYIRTGNGGDLLRRSDYPDKLDFPDHLVFASRDALHYLLSEQGLAPNWEAAKRLDTVLGVCKSVAKRLIGRPVPIRLPYTSPFRDYFVRANRQPF